MPNSLFYLRSSIAFLALILIPFWMHRFYTHTQTHTHTQRDTLRAGSLPVFPPWTHPWANGRSHVSQHWCSVSESALLAKGKQSSECGQIDPIAAPALTQAPAHARMCIAMCSKQLTVADDAALLLRCRLTLTIDTVTEMPIGIWFLLWGCRWHRRGWWPMRTSVLCPWLKQSSVCVAGRVYCACAHI